MNEHRLNDGAPVRSRREDLVDESPPLGVRRPDDALLDDVARELLLREREDLAVDLGDDERLVGGLALLDDPLDDVLEKQQEHQYADFRQAGEKDWGLTLPYWSWIKP